MSHTAVVILNYNGEKLLRQYLPSVLSYSGSAEIIVADNASTDQSVIILQDEFPSVKLILLEKNFGFCGGYNRALQQVKADYYVLLNSDVEVTPNWLAPLQQLLDNDEHIAAVQPKILSFTKKDLFEYAGAAGGFIDSFGYPFCRGRILDTVEKDRQQYNDTREIFWATGACLMLRAHLYHEFNGLDEDFFAHMEEIDLCWKMQRAGYKIYYSGNSQVYHLGAGTLGYASPRKTYLNFRNGLALITKHFDTWELWLKLPLRMLLDWAAALMFMFRSQFEHTKAVAKAHVHFFRSLGSTLNKRKALRSRYKSYPRNTVYPGLVLVRYYLLRKKTYEERFR